MYLDQLLTQFGISGAWIEPDGEKAGAERRRLARAERGKGGLCGAGAVPELPLAAADHERQLAARRDVRPDPLQHAQPGFATRFLLQNALCLPLVAGGVHQRLAIDVALVGDDQRPILLRAVIPTIGRAQL